MHKLSYRRHRFPGIVIQQAVWLYFRFALSYRDVEDLSRPCMKCSCGTISFSKPTYAAPRSTPAVTTRAAIHWYAKMTFATSSQG